MSDLRRVGWIYRRYLEGTLHRYRDEKDVSAIFHRPIARRYTLARHLWKRWKERKEND